MKYSRLTYHAIWRAQICTVYEKAFYNKVQNIHIHRKETNLATVEKDHNKKEKTSKTHKQNTKKENKQVNKQN